MNRKDAGERLRDVCFHPAWSVLLLVVPVAVYAAGRFPLTAQVIAAEVLSSAVLADILFGAAVVCLAFAAGHLHLALSAVAAGVLFSYHVVTMEMIVSLDTVPTLWDLRFVNREFMAASGVHFQFLGYLALLLLSIVPLVIGIKKLRGGTARWAGSLLVCGAAVAALTLSPVSPGWATTNTTYLSLRKTAVGRRIAGIDNALPARAAHSDTEREQEPRDGATASSPAPFGERLLGKSTDKRPNLLLVVLEGIPGVYLRQVQEATGVRYPVVMEELSRIAEDALVVPDFLTHSRQTIRGLYAMLTGDYSKLSITTPKIYDYMQLAEGDRPPALPAILRSHGYRTTFLQAPDLSYMSKGAFMPVVGFDEVHGQEFFEYQYVPFNWGPDDKAFLEQSYDYITEVHAESEDPWFITLLTVGTHHPYAVPDDFAADYDLDKVAAVAYLDEAIGTFYRGLEEAGILDNTVVVFTCDESHGVTGQPHGRYWGLMMVRTPESTGIINPGVFGLVDIPASLLDYLEIGPIPPSYPGYSVFRTADRERGMLFGPYYSEEQGVFLHTTDQRTVERFVSSNGMIFAPVYDRTTQRGDEGAALAERIIGIRRRANQSLASRVEGPSLYTFLEDNRFTLEESTSILTTGQFLDLPGGSTVSVSLRAHGVSGSSFLRPEMIQWTVDLGAPPVEAPALEAGETLTVEFHFPVEEDVSRVWAALYARAGSEGLSEVNIEHFTLSVDTETVVDGFEITEMQVSGNPGQTIAPESAEAGADRLPVIAHAGGAVDGYIYSNSMEALRANVGRYRHFEIDLHMTADGKLVGLHSWGRIFEGYFGFTPEPPLTLAEIEAADMAGGFTVATVPRIVAFLEEHPGTRIITDAKSSPEATNEELLRLVPNAEERIIPQVYTPGQFVHAVELGYQSLIWALYRYDGKWDPEQLARDLDAMKRETGRYPYALSIHEDVVSDRHIEAASERGIPVYVHTVNDCETYLDLLERGVESIYTDYLDPEACLPRQDSR